MRIMQIMQIIQIREAVMYISDGVLAAPVRNCWASGQAFSRAHTQSAPNLVPGIADGRVTHQPVA